MTATVVVLGGYGNFGRHICAALAGDDDIRVLIAGRDPGRAAALARQLGARCEALVLDAEAPDLAQRLQACAARVLIHTAGPFQQQDYRVAEACIAAGCHYLDLADGRSYVAGIAALHASALARGVLVVTGASSVPALSAAVADHYRPQFTQLDALDIAISSSALPPGLATMQAVLGYVGKPFRRWQRGGWTTVHGWQDLRLRRFPGPIGWRWLGNCDVPDLELFPRRYAGAKTVVFRAGLGHASSTLATWALSWLVRAGLLDSLAPLAAGLHRLATVMARWGTAWSAMHVQLRGAGAQGLPLQRDWFLAGACWLPVVWLQLRMRDIALLAVEQGGALPAAYWRCQRLWFVLGVPAFSGLVVVFWLMVFKPSSL